MAKYIVFKAGDQEIPVIFPDILVHRHVASGIKQALMVDYASVAVLRAGFVRDVKVGFTGGESETLRLTSCPTDKEVIERACNL